MNATNAKGHIWTGETTQEGQTKYWHYIDDSTDAIGSEYQSTEQPAYRIALNATQAIVAGKRTIVPIHHTP